MSEYECTEFIVPVVYVQPNFWKLKRWFQGYVNLDYKGARFYPIERCKVVSKESCEIVLEYVYMDRFASTDDVLAEMDRNGLRPALYEELLSFAEKYPDEQLKYLIVALGSWAKVYGSRGRYIAFLCHYGLVRRLLMRWVGNGWSVDYRFLAVRK